MAGDWIKFEHATLDKPEVLLMAEMLGWDRRQAVGLLLDFWCWLDKNLSASCPGFVRHMSKKSLDDVFRTPGFASALEVIGWARFDDSALTMRVVNAERHNGNTAKTRALDAKRKKEKRLGNVREMSASQPDVSGTRGEKRREDIKDIHATRRKAKPKTPLAESFALSTRVIDWAQKKGYGNLQAHLDNFRLQAAAKGYTYSDWDAAFMRAIADDWAGLRRGAQPPPAAQSVAKANAALEAAKHAREVAVPPPPEFQERMDKLIRKMAMR